MADNNLNSTTSKKYIYSNDTVSLPKDTFRMALRDSYESGVHDESSVSFGKFWSSLLSFGISLLLTFLSCENFRHTDNIDSKTIAVIVLVLAIIFMLAGIASLIFAASRTKKKDNRRDLAVNNVYEGLGFVLKPSQSKGKQKEIPIQTDDDKTV